MYEMKNLMTLGIVFSRLRTFVFLDFAKDLL
jgi:hypothetical protein